MKKVILTAGLVTMAALAPIHTPLSSLHAQTEQRIVVSEYKGREGKTPLEGVSVTVLNAAASVTDSQGEATLRFRTLHVGDRVTVRRVVKEGYEIFNSQAIEQWNISNQRPFNIVLCQSARFKELRDNYTRVAMQSYERQYKAEQARLAKERKRNNMLDEVYQQKLTELENQYQQQLEDLDNYVDQFARIDLSELNENQQELIEMVKRGEIDKAIQKYESDDYQGQYRKQCEELAKIDRAQAQLKQVEAQKRAEREKVYQTIGRQIATYRLAGGRENFQKVDALMKAVADADTTEYEVVYAYARHCLMQHHYEECEKYFKIYTNVCADRPFELSCGLYLIAQSYMLQHELSKAEECYVRAVAIRQELAAKDYNKYAPSLLMVQSALIQYYLWVGKNAEADSLLTPALAIGERLYQEEPENYQEQLAALYESLSTLQISKEETDAAFASAQKCYELARQQYEQFDNYPPLSRALDVIGYLSYTSGNWQKLAVSEKEHAEIAEKLYEKNPDEQLTYLESIYNNLAEAYLHLENYPACLNALQRAEALLNEWIGKQAETAQYAAFNLYDVAAHYYDKVNDKAKAQQYVKAAQEAFQKMAPEEQEQNQELMDALLKL